MSWRNLIWLAIIVALAGLSLYLAKRRSPNLKPEDPAVKQLVGAIQAYKTIQQSSSAPLTPEQACRGAIDGMVRQLEFSAYLPPGRVDAFSARMRGELEETGLRIALENHRLVTLGALPNSPAAKAGITSGLEILAVNDLEARYLPLAQARDLLERPGTARLELRSSGGQTTSVALESARFEIQTVGGLVRYGADKWTHVLDDKERLYYIRIGEFVERTPRELQAAYRRLDEPRGLVLDLRDNPGGALPEAVEVADLFLEKGQIVRIVSGGQERLRYAHADGTFPPLPLIVLVNEHTASAAEIVAGALQAHGRARLVGQTTFGKWCVQTLIPLGYGLGEVYIPTGEYFLPEPAASTLPGTRTRPLAAATASRRRGGVEPDVPVRLTVAAAEQLEELRLQALVQPSGLLATTLPDRLSRAERLRREILAADAQLTRALDLLRPPRATGPATAPDAGAAARAVVPPVRSAPATRTSASSVEPPTGAPDRPVRNGVAYD